VARRVGNALREGLIIGQKRFYFLAYSQSALKEHAVWFMRPFYDKDHNLIDASSIISSLGNFGVDYDRTLIFCPGKYGARISQAFTATDSSISVEPEEILPLDDIKRLKDPDDPESGWWVFTDGVGTISAELAKEIWKALRDKRRRARRAPTYPRCYQIRFMGCKVKFIGTYFCTRH
jgi:RNA-dependent RNA polymerase